MWLVATVLDSEAVSYEGGDFVVLTAVGLDDVWQRAGLGKSNSFNISYNKETGRLLIE